MGAPPDVSGLEDPPPQILLDPSAPVTRSPTAICDSFYKRCTLNAVPQTPGLLSKSRLPFGLILTPFRSLRENEVGITRLCLCLCVRSEPLPTVSDNTIVRCRSCRTYINPFVQFLEGGNSWKCNICYLVNDVPSSFDFDQTTGQPVNRWERVELNHAVFEYIAPSEYMSSRFLTVLRLANFRWPTIGSAPAGPGVCVCDRRVIRGCPIWHGGHCGKNYFGYLGSDSQRGPQDQDRIHYCRQRCSLLQHWRRSSPQMLVVSDLEEVYLPQPEDLLCNLAESRTVVDTLLEQMGVMFKDTQNDGNALGPALQAAFKLLVRW
ncbi:MAG: hypothetical protein BJ554DRAFT_2793 [Olpidium bornovanus]|uniref:Protein transport protein SEC23 n=1 Tax=Olpidium bornovanus TaxID=278681 RepID=A0A8H7ZQ96_9FUNG|nr:MAG: hypothetical protein BJ554DRAFT_2793 [Olpidium bornovanus]